MYLHANYRLTDISILKCRIHNSRDQQTRAICRAIVARLITIEFAFGYNIEHTTTHRYRYV